MTGGRARSRRAPASHALGLLVLTLGTASLALPGCERGERPAATFPLPANLPEPTSPLEAALRARGPTDAPTLVPFAAPFIATYAEGEHHSFTAVLRGGGICYKVLGQGGEGVTDVDLLVYDPHNVLQQRDNSSDAVPIVGGRRPMCPSEPGAWRVEVIAAAGAGEIAAQLWVAP